MFKSFIAGILALVAATFGIHHTGISTRPTSLAQSAQTRSAQLAAADTPQRYPVSASTSPIYPPTPKPIGTAPQLSDLSSQGSQASPGTPSTPSRTINTTLAAQLANPFLAYATKADLASATAALQSEIAALGAPTAQVPQQVAAGGNFANPFAAAQSINNLAGVTITNPTITGLTASEIPAISLLNGVTGVLPLDSGGTGWANVNAGSILFGNGASALATSSNLFWDNTDGRLGIGTTTPTAILTLDSSSPNGTIMRVSNSSTGGHIYDWLSTGSGNTGGAGRLDLFDYTEGAARLSIAGNGNVGIGTTTPGSLFSVQGIANWTNATSTYYSTGGVNLTSGCFAIVGNCLGLANIAGTLATNQGGTGTTTWQTGSIPFFNGTNFAENNPLLFWDNTNDRLGVGTGSPFTQLTVPGYSTPVEIASISTGLTNPIAIYVQGRYAYVTDGSSGALIIFDISNPASPTEISSTVLGGTNLSAVYVQGRYAYVINQTTNNYHLHILDISNPTAPVVVSSISTGLNAPKAVYVQGRYAYVASAGNHSLVIFDISNPAAPVMASSISAGLSSPGSVYVQGRYAYVGDTGNNSLVIFDISDPALPVEVVSFSTGISHPQSIYVQGRYAYVTNFNNGGSLEVVDVSNPSSPVEAGSTAAGLTHANGLYVQGRYAYVTNAFSLADSRLVVFDVSNPDSPAEVGSVSAGLNSPSAPSVYVQGRYAYIMSGGNASLVIFDLGGGYVQQLEAGGLETGTLSVRNNFQALDGEFQGGLTIGNNLNVGGSFDLTASTFNATTTPGRNYSIFSINAASSTAPLFTTLYDGNIGIGTSSPDARLTVWGPDTASTSAFVVSNSASTTEFAVYDTGNAVLSGGLTQNSDERLKTNIQSLDASSSLSAIDALTPVSFDWVNGIFGGGDQLGFIAQAVQTIFPELVSTTSPTALTPNGTLGLNYSGLIAPIVGAIKGIARISGDFETNLIAWLGNAGNGIDHLFASEIDTQRLCVGSTCINQQQLAALLASQGGGSSEQGSGNSGASESSTPDTPPIIQLNGDNPATIQVGATYQDLGATITGPQQDVNLGIQAIVDGEATTTPDQIQIDTTAPGTHAIVYSATDQSGLTGTATRTVIVQAPASPSATTTTPSNNGEGDTGPLSTTTAPTSTP